MEKRIKKWIDEINKEIQEDNRPFWKSFFDLNYKGQVQMNKKEDYTCGICKLNGNCITQKKDGRTYGCKVLWEECNAI